MKVPTDFALRIVNLSHRNDRKTQITADCKEHLGIDLLQEHFHCAHHDPVNGALGCAISHHAVLSDFVERGQADHLVVFEDDLQFRQPTNLTQLITALRARVPHFDVFLLAHNKAVPLEHLGSVFFKVANSQTTAGYIVTRHFAARLQRSFGRSVAGLSKYQGLPEPYNKFAKHLFSIDMLWKELQIDNLFVSTTPSLAVQRPGYSDVEQTDVRYGV